MIQKVLTVMLSLLVIAYPLMGLAQILSALVSFFRGENIYPGYRSKLKKYLLGAVVYFVVLLFCWNVFNVERNMNEYMIFLIPYLFILPWGLAIYFWRMVYHKKEP